MRKAAFASALVLALVLSTAAQAVDAVKRGGGADGWGPKSKYGRMYDVKTVTTVSGTVSSVDTFIPPGARYGGVHLTLKTYQGDVQVHLGPSWFIENQGFEITSGDVIEVTGSKVDYKGSEAIIAATLRKEDRELLLRDESGIPFWQHYKRGR